MFCLTRSLRSSWWLLFSLSHHEPRLALQRSTPGRLDHRVLDCEVASFLFVWHGHMLEFERVQLSQAVWGVPSLF